MGCAGVKQVATLGQTGGTVKEKHTENFYGSQGKPLRHQLKTKVLVILDILTFIKWADRQ